MMQRVYGRGSEDIARYERELSCLVFAAEGDFSEADCEEIMTCYPQVGHALVGELSECDSDGAGAALAWLEEEPDEDVHALIRWMADGGFKGWFQSAAEFCELEFYQDINERIDGWDGRDERGFPDSFSFAEEYVNWSAVAENAVGAGGRFYAIDMGAGVYIFDMGNRLNDYRLVPVADPCQWFALCTNGAVAEVPHPVLGAVPTCQRCIDQHKLLGEAAS